ncbi:hypothetical protein [Paraburkholderia sp. C35]|uniref:hypothetical protein n=1 Tax=Paraburkholderia sp. C35 TaxID=2126993 RepID=UPI0031BA7552
MTHAITFEKSSAREQVARPQDEDRTTVQQERIVSEQLWCVHIEGLEDFVAAMSREAAEREASAINAYLACVKERQGAPGGIVRATAIVWPFTPAGHARSLETDWHDLQRMPHRQAPEDAGRRDGAMSRLLQRLSSFVSRSRSKR